MDETEKSTRSEKQREHMRYDIFGEMYENELRQSKHDTDIGTQRNRHTHTYKIMQNMSETHSGNTGKWCDALCRKIKFTINLISHPKTQRDGMGEVKTEKMPLSASSRRVRVIPHDLVDHPFFSSENYILE